MRFVSYHRESYLLRFTDLSKCGTPISDLQSPPGCPSSPPAHVDDFFSSVLQPHILPNKKLHPKAHSSDHKFEKNCQLHSPTQKKSPRAPWELLEDPWDLGAPDKSSSKPGNAAWFKVGGSKQAELTKKTLPVRPPERRITQTQSCDPTL